MAWGQDTENVCTEIHMDLVVDGPINPKNGSGITRGTLPPSSGNCYGHGYGYRTVKPDAMDGSGDGCGDDGYGYGHGAGHKPKEWIW